MDVEERAWLMERLRRDASLIEAGGGHTGSHRSIFSVLKEPRVALMGVFFFFALGSFYAFSFSAPKIYLAATGWSVNGVGVLIAAISIVGAVAMLGVSWHSDKLKMKVPHIVVLCATTAAGFAVSGIAQNAWVVVVALALATVSYYGMQGPSLGMLTTFMDGPSAAVGIAAANMLAIAGGFAGPVWMGWSIGYTGGTRLGTGMLGVAYSVAAGLIVVVARTKRGAGSVV